MPCSDKKASPIIFHFFFFFFCILSLFFHAAASCTITVLIITIIMQRNIHIQPVTIVPEFNIRRGCRFSENKRMVLMKGNIICFFGKIRKIIPILALSPFLSEAL